MNPSKNSRRHFLTTAAGAASLNLLPSGTLFGASPKPNDKMSVAFIGMGSRIQGHVKNLIGQGHHVAALCDADSNQIDRSRAAYGASGAKATAYGDYRELLEKEKSLDAVVIGTPDHWHAPICKAAMAAGKHVYCEKPLTHTIAEARELRGLAKESDVVTQMGNQGSASSNLRRSMELIAAGVFGPIREVHAWHPTLPSPNGEPRPEGSDPAPEGLDSDRWCGPAPLRPYKNGIYHPRSWRAWYDFGNGSLGDFCCHAFNLPMRALHLDYPSRVEVSGTGLGFESFAKSCTVRLHFPKIAQRDYEVALNYFTGGGEDVPPTRAVEAAVHTFGGLPRVGCILVGDKGMLSAGLWNSDCYVRMNGEPKYLGAGKHPATKDIPQSISRVGDHLREWVDACAGKGGVFADFEHGGHLTEIGLSGVVALRLQENIEWDGVGMKVKGRPEADRFVDKSVREKWL